MSGGAAAERAEYDAHEGGRQHDGAYADQAGLHGGLALLQLVRAAARSGVLNRPPHEGEDANRDRDVADRCGKIGEQRVDVAVH